MNKAVLEDLARALNKTRLVEGSVLQAFLSRVVCWRGNEAKLPNVHTTIPNDRDTTPPFDRERPEDVFTAEKILPLDG